MRSYDHKKIERKWQKKWASQKTYATKEGTGKKKAYILDMFPYPSGEGLHVGHPKGYIATDTYSRMRRMQGYSVLHPMGWDAFGLPAENFAIKNKIHPKKAVDKNIKRFKEQLSMIGLDYDWSREINTTDPEYYKWTQWIFLELYKKGLAYESYEPINWCPSCQTGLANEDLEGNACERCGSIVEKRPMRQWVLKITDYAERLLNDLELLPQWQEHIKESQRNWIGKSEGAEIDFLIAGNTEKLRVFTTRPDTLFGATYMVVAPEHSLIGRLHSQIKNLKEIEAYARKASAKSEIERTAEGKEKTGVCLEGVTAINPATQEEIPIFVADYVLAHYGTGAIMAVPAHDERDFAFAKKFNIPIKQVIAPETGIKRDNEERRDGGCAVIFDPVAQRYAVAKNPSGIYGLFAGGIDAGESFQDGILREVREESGFYDFLHIEEIGATYSHFHNPRKNVNRFCLAKCMLVILKSTDTKNLQLQDHEDFELHWTDAVDILDNWKRLDTDKNRDHWDQFLRDAVSRTIELGYDKTSDKLAFTRTTFTGEGLLLNSNEFDEISSAEARQKITKKYGTPKVTYKLRDWVFSRQRYWGEPIPIIHCEKCGTVPVPEKDLPVKLPDVKRYEPTGTGESPLAAIEKWVRVKCPVCRGPARRETNTMPQWAGSSWYYLRYMDPKNKKALVDKKKDKYWAPVDLYVGGAEHATRHLIYARFWHKFLYDIKAVSTKEPFTRLISVGLIQAEDGRKMSKRFGNVINPDDIIARYGADTLRVYEMFMGPFTDAIAWNTNSMIGARRFLERAWRLQFNLTLKADSAIEASLHKTIKKVGEDIENFKFNTAISQMMIFVNEVEKSGLTKKQFATFLAILAPFAPHMTEEMWSALGNKKTIHHAPWPKYDKRKLVEDTVTIVVQVNGKVRANFPIASDASEGNVKAQAEKHAGEWLSGKSVKRVIYVPGRLVNFVVD